MIKNILRGLSLRPVSYYKVYREIMGSTVGGLMLSQLMYWHSVSGNTIYKVDEDWIDELELTDGEIRGGKANLKEQDFIAIELRGVPAKTYYTIDWEGLGKAIEKASIRIEQKREERAVKKREKAVKRALKVHKTTVGLKEQNKLCEIARTSSDDLGEPVRAKEQNQFGQKNRTSSGKRTEHYYTENTTENTKRTHIEESKSIMKFFNALLESNYKLENKHVIGLLQNGFTQTDITHVIKKKHKEWFNSPSESFIRPSILFGKNFEEYLQSNTKESREKDRNLVCSIIKKVGYVKKTLLKHSVLIENFKYLKQNQKTIFEEKELLLLRAFPNTNYLLSLLAQNELEAELYKIIRVTL